jgi:hypothetical protein
MKRWLVTGFGFVCLVMVYAVVGDIRTRNIQRKHEAAYEATLGAYRDSLPIGITRAQVEAYLQDKGVSFHAFCCADQEYTDTDATQIGQESAHWFCGATYVYVEFQFSTGTNHSVPRDSSDRLKKIDLRRKLAHCL